MRYKSLQWGGAGRRVAEVWHSGVAGRSLCWLGVLDCQSRNRGAPGVPVEWTDPVKTRTKSCNVSVVQPPCLGKGRYTITVIQLPYVTPCSCLKLISQSSLHSLLRWKGIYVYTWTQCFLSSCETKSHIESLLGFWSQVTNPLLRDTYTHSLRLSSSKMVMLRRTSMSICAHPQSISRKSSADSPDRALSGSTSYTPSRNFYMGHNSHIYICQECIRTGD